MNSLGVGPAQTSPLRDDRHGVARLRQRFLGAWARSDEIFAIVGPEGMLSKPIVWRHPFIFYVGHLPAFSWNQFCGGMLKWKSINPYFDDLFCRGIDPDVDTGECHWHPDVPAQWPSLRETVAYRDRVRAAILDALAALPQTHSDDIMACDGRIFEMLLDHEAMHQETLLYLIQQLPIERKHRPMRPLRYSFESAAESKPIHIPVGEACLGAKFADTAFGWDNEFSESVIDVPAFAIDSLPVTNGEFLEFVQSGAYDDVRYWRPDDWRWKCLENKMHPTCWQKRSDGWCYRAMFAVFPLEQVARWPVYVSLAEARAYAQWRGKRLPTEAEFHRAAFYGPDGREMIYPWGDATPAAHYGNFDFAAWSPQPVGSCPAGASRWGVSELIGNGWELTDSPFAPLPGFTPYITGYPEYSQDFFDGKHFVLKGASWATVTDLIRPSFRNWYQEHYPYVFAKFRCVSD
jgi:ergothioneine biosynthesis protein EgtB